MGPAGDVFAVLVAVLVTVWVLVLLLVPWWLALRLWASRRPPRA